MKRHAQTMAVQGGRRGRVGKSRWLRWGAGRGYRRNAGRPGRCGQEFQSSRHRKLERKRIAAAGSRRESRGQVGGWNRLRREDFEERAQRRANGMSPKVDRRSSANRSSCGRRTSLGPGGFSGRTAAAALPISITIMQMFSKPGARFDTAAACVFTGYYCASMVVKRLPEERDERSQLEFGRRTNAVRRLGFI